MKSDFFDLTAEKRRKVVPTRSLSRLGRRHLTCRHFGSRVSGRDTVLQRRIGDKIFDEVGALEGSTVYAATGDFANSACQSRSTCCRVLYFFTERRLVWWLAALFGDSSSSGCLKDLCYLR